MERTIEEAKADMLAAIPFFRHLVAQVVSEGGIPKLALLAENNDHTGQIKASFECEEFFRDLALILDAPPQTDDDNARAAAAQFKSLHRIDDDVTDV